MASQFRVCSGTAQGFLDRLVGRYCSEFVIRS